MRVFVEPYGCTLNKGDARRMARVLLRDGHGLAAGRDDADAVVLVTCCVIEATENNMVRQLKAIRDAGKPVVVAGCMAVTTPNRLLPDDPGVMVLPLQRMDYVSEALEAVVEDGGEGGDGTNEPGEGGGGTLGERQEETYGGRGEKTGHRRCYNAAVSCSIYEEPIPGEELTPDHSQYQLSPEGAMVGGIVPIASGCLGECTYCITRSARGPLASAPPENAARLLAEEVMLGHSEIKLTAQDTGAYGRDMGFSLAGLLELLTGLDIPDMGDRHFRIRVGMMNPDRVKDDLDVLIPLWGGDRMFRFLHLPVQSGDDGILTAMGRRYTVAEFENIVARFREAHPDLTLSTDVIPGFPGEGEEEFMRTVSLIERVRPDILNITRFSPRPGTPAWERRKEDPHPRIAKERSRILTRLHTSMAEEKLKLHMGRQLELMVTEKGKGSTTTCRTANYIPVIIEGVHPAGRRAEAVIVESNAFYLKGRVGRWLD